MPKVLAAVKNGGFPSAVGETPEQYVVRYLIDHLKGLDWALRRKDANTAVAVDESLATP